MPRMEKIAVISQFKVYDELAAGMAEVGLTVLPCPDLTALRERLSRRECDTVFDINFHAEIWEECVRAEVGYTVWSFDSNVVKALSGIDSSRLRPNDRLFLFNCREAAEISAFHPSTWYLPFAAGHDFERPPRRRDFRYEVAFVMNSYVDTRQQAERDFRVQWQQAEAVERRRLELAYEMSETLVSGLQYAYGDRQVEYHWNRLAVQCGLDPLGPDPAVRGRFFRGVGQLISARQRETCLRALGAAGFQVAVYGDDYWRGVAADYSGVTFFGSADYAALPEIYNAAKINLNLTQVQNLDSVPQRIFHLLAAGGFTLTNSSSPLTELFCAGTHLQTFFAPAELTEGVRYYLVHDRDRIKIAERGHDEFLRHHRLADRLRRIFAD